MTEETIATNHTFKEAELISTGIIPDQDGGIKAIIDLTNKAAEIKLRRVDLEGLGPGLPKDIPVMVDHRPGGKVSGLGDVIEAYRQYPKAITGRAQVLNLQSFIDLTNRHKNDASVIFANTSWPQPTLTTVVDYHLKDGTPRWLKHQINYDFPITEEFKAWAENNGKPMEQLKFAEFLEEHIADLASPFDGERNDLEHLFKEKLATPSELVALSRHLEVFVGAKVKRAERLSSGERTVEFTEEHTNVKGEKVDIPGLFIIALPAFIGGEPVRIPARLRYRLVSGSISWFYQLYKEKNYLRERIREDLRLASEATQLPAFEGSPEH